MAEGAAEDEAVEFVFVVAAFALILELALALGPVAEEVRGGGGAAGDEAGSEDVLIAAAVVAGASSA